MYIELDQGGVSKAPKAVDLPGLDDKDVARAGFEVLPIDGPETAPFLHELDFIVGMPMGAGTAPGQAAKEEHGDIHISVIGADEMMGAALEW